MKKVILSLIVALGLLSGSAFAGCTYQTFDGPSYGIWTEIKESSSSYNTHHQSADHRQCWNAHAFENVRIKALSHTVETNMNVDPHGYLVMHIYDAHETYVNIKVATEITTNWKMAVTNYNKDGIIKNQLHYSCKRFSSIPHYQGMPYVSTKCHLM